MTPAEHISAARDYLHLHGWCQGHVFDDHGRACLLGALHASWTGDAWNLLGWQDTAILLQGMLPIGIFAWNDDPDRTFEDVDEFLREAKGMVA